ncbi:SHOCT domain-containing protein [Clostridium lacusfryxellense]|nr:SHOCT domain-containing protein [Clostridium lacusfryxellense]
MMGGSFGMIIIPIILIGIVMFAVTRQGENNNVKDNSSNILNERFARGEINEDEYTHKKNMLLNDKKHKKII